MGSNPGLGTGGTLPLSMTMGMAELITYAEYDAKYVARAVSVPVRMVPFGKVPHTGSSVGINVPVGLGMLTWMLYQSV